MKFAIITIDLSTGPTGTETAMVWHGKAGLLDYFGYDDQEDESSEDEFLESVLGIPFDEITTNSEQMLGEDYMSIIPFETEADLLNTLNAWNECDTNRELASRIVALEGGDSIEYAYDDPFVARM